MKGTLVALFIRFRSFLIRLKVYMARTGSYIGLVNTALLLFLFLSNLEKYNINVRIESWIIPLFIIGLCAMLLFGFLEDKYGFYALEQKTTQSRNPFWSEMMEKLDHIEKRIDELEKKR